MSWIEPNQGQNTSPWAWHCWTPGLVKLLYLNQCCYCTGWHRHTDYTFVTDTQITHCRGTEALKDTCDYHYMIQDWNKSWVFVTVRKDIRRFNPYTVDNQRMSYLIFLAQGVTVFVCPSGSSLNFNLQGALSRIFLTSLSALSQLTLLALSLKTSVGPDGA